MFSLYKVDLDSKAEKAFVYRLYSIYIKIRCLYTYTYLVWSHETLYLCSVVGLLYTLYNNNILVSLCVQDSIKDLLGNFDYLYFIIEI